jgi:hypothetical protein
MNGKNKMKRIVIVLALAACAPQQPVFKPATVDIPIAQPCHAAMIAKPNFALSHVAVTDDLFSKTRAALVELDQRKAYEAELESEQGVCQ